MTAPFAPGRGDAHLAALLGELQRGGDRDLLRATVLLLATARQEGDSCVRLGDWSGRTLPGLPPFPPAAHWREELLASGLCAGDGTLPLCLDEADRLWLRRHFRAEQRIAAAIRRALADPPAVDPARLAAALRAAFPDLGADEPDWQAVAVLAAVRSRLAVITGGPGTGKTTTTARLLQVLRALQPDLRLALCAPTGKAAARLAESLAQAGAALGEPERPRTLHRLLGYLPQHDAFRFGPDRRLPFDLVVLDEASMVDLLLMDALLQALPDDGRLVLLGDRDQLSSVAPGQVLGDLCRIAAPERGAGPRLRQDYAAITGTALPGQPQPLADAVVMLHRNWRFRGPGLGAFARALAGGGRAAALAALRAGSPDLACAEPRDLAAALQPAEPALLALRDAADASAALAALGRFRVLCATRHGPFGVEACNRALQAPFQGLARTGPWFRGRPVLVTRNDLSVRLMNGDVGVCWPDAEGRMQVWFPTAEGLRPIAPIRMPECETAFAMTVHKAQGSEFDEVLLLLPDQDGPLCHAPLVYTAVTRARVRATIHGPLAVLEAALSRWPERSSGLAAMLAAPEAPA